MSNYSSLTRLFIFLLMQGMCFPLILAQPDTESQILALQNELEQLRVQMAEMKQAAEKQKLEYESKLEELNVRLDNGLASEISQIAGELIADRSKFYSRPAGRDGGTPPFIFDTLEGGLIFTGLFRFRAEFRRNNVDFNSNAEGFDDEGVRVNGRFRLGFGAVLVQGSDSEPGILALTEFQAVGSLANNTFFSFAPTGGVNLPTQFNVFREPFEQVGIYQGYLDFQRVLAQDLYMKVGRQEIVFGNEFIFGNNSFFDGTVHDGVVMEYRGDGFSLSAFGLKQAQSDGELSVSVPGSDFDEDWLAGVYATIEAGPDVLIDAYALYFDNRSNSGDPFLTASPASAFDQALNPTILGHFWTFGLRAFVNQIRFLGGDMSLNAEIAFQTGTNGLDIEPGGLGFEEQEIKGFAGEFQVTWWLRAGGLDPVISLSYYYAQGGDANGSAENGLPLRRVGFQPLFINRHFDSVGSKDYIGAPHHAGGGRYGNMDIFPLSNIHLMKAAISIVPSSETEIGIAFITGLTADDEGFGTGIFGHEVDLFGVYNYSPNLQFSANFSIFFPQKTAQDMSEFLFFAGTGLPTRPDNDAAFAFYIQALISF